MPFDTIADIKKAITRVESDMQSLVTRWDDDYDLLTLAEFEAKKGYESYTSPAPRNFFNKVIDALNRAVVTTQIKLPEDASDKEREGVTKGEMFLLGGLNAADRLLVKRGEPTLRRGLGFFMGARGWYMVRALVYVPKDREETVFDISYWDPMHVTYERGSDGLLWAAHKRMLTASQAMGEYGIDTGDKDVEVIDFWDEEKNSVIVGAEWGKEPESHDIGHVPVLAGAIGSMPTMQPGRLDNDSTADNTSMLADRGDSVWTTSRKLYEPINRHVSRVMDMAKKALVGTLVHKTKDGKSKIEGDPHEAFQVIPLKHGDSLEPLEAPEAPPEVGALLRVFGADLQQSTLPDPLAYGGTEAPESGRALAIRLEATRSAFNPYTEAMASVYTWVCEEMLSQFSSKGVKPALIQGFDNSNEFFQMRVKPDEVDKDWFVQVRVEPRLPRDEETEIAMAAAATAKPSPDEQPLMSKRSAREDILRLKDPDAEEQRILIELGESMPPIVIAKVAAALEKQGETELARQILELGQNKEGQAQAQGQGQAQGGDINALLDVLMRAFVEAGVPQIAQALAGILQGGPTAPAAPPTAPAPAAAPPPAPAPEPAPPTLPSELLARIVEVLQNKELAEAIMNVVGALPPELVEAVVQDLISTGNQELARELLIALGVDIPEEQGA
jgi:hypothetical protein